MLNTNRQAYHHTLKHDISYREKLSLAYAFVAWNLFGYMAYMIYTGRWTKQEKEDKEAELSTGETYLFFLVF